jgi:hypothetical protein
VNTAPKNKEEEDELHSEAAILAHDCGFVAIAPKDSQSSKKVDRPLLGFAKRLTKFVQEGKKRKRSDKEKGEKFDAECKETMKKAKEDTIMGDEQKFEIYKKVDADKLTRKDEVKQKAQEIQAEKMDLSGQGKGCYAKMCALNYGLAMMYKAPFGRRYRPKLSFFFFSSHLNSLFTNLLLFIYYFVLHSLSPIYLTFRKQLGQPKKNKQGPAQGLGAVEVRQIPHDPSC